MPDAPVPGDAISAQLCELVMLCAGRRLAVLTGAGVSTDSGIPDYRGPGTRARARQPMRFRAFISDEANRRRYWARASVGYSRVSRAAPGPAHQALAALNDAGVLCGLVTQNVDGLHQAAGHSDVIELHGALSRVLCLDCGLVEARAEVQARIAASNPGLTFDVKRFAPDGDADVDDEALASFVVPACLACGGPLKPDVVFFGEDVPRDRVAAAAAIVDDAQALLVAGSSLTVFSGYRFVRQARQRGIPVIVATIGPSRGDADATLKLDAPVATVLPALRDALVSRTGASAK